MSDGRSAGLSLAGRAQLMALLFLVALISYLDRGSLSIAAPVLIRELNLSPIQMGVLLSSFFWSYTLLQIPGGWLADRFPVGWVLGCGVALWSLATLASGLVSSVGMLIVMRVILGAGESVVFPCFSKTIACTFPPNARAMPNSLIDAGAKLGPAVGVLAGGLLVARYGWRVQFIVLGVIGLIWLGPWLMWANRHKVDAASAPQQSTVAAQASDAAPGFRDLLRNRDLWGVVLGSSTFTYTYYFLLTWLPTYLVKERHMSMESMAVLGSAPYWASAATVLAAGWVSDALIRRGVSPTVVRKSFVAVGLLLSMVALPSAMVPDVGLSIWLLSLAYVAFGIFGSNWWTISQTLAGPVAAGKWVGIQNSIGSVMGIAAPLVTGLIVQRTGSFLFAFVLTAILAVGGAASYVFLVGPIEPIDWAAQRARLSLAPAAQ